MLRIFRQYYPIRNIFFVIGESIFIYISVLIATDLLYDSHTFSSVGLFSRKALLIAFVCMACLYLNDVYDLKVTNSYLELGIRMLQALGTAAIILGIIYFIFKEMVIGKNIFFVTIVIAMLLIITWRFCYTIILKHGVFDQKIIILGSAELAKKIIMEIYEKQDCGYKIAAIVLKNNSTDFSSFTDLSVIYRKRFKGLLNMAREMSIKKIVLTLKEKRGTFPTRELLNCRVEGIDILEGNSFYETLAGKLTVEQINPGWLIFSEGFHKSHIERFFKRIIDLSLSTLMLLVLSPIFLITSILIRIDSKGPVFFTQDRVGERKRQYKIYKFRSMVEGAEKKSGPVWASNNDDRITRVGRFIRKWRIDELPQLWNVLRGEMSFTGPRPERDHFVKELEEIIPYYSERFTVKPGITGWAQVCYGYGASVEDAIEKLNYDLFYIKNMSIFMDMIIILRTVKIVLFGKGAR